MQIQQNISLSKFSTMRLGGNASYLCEIANKNDLLEAVNFSKEKNLQTIMIGGGSNIVWADTGFDGLIIVNNVHEYSAKTDGQGHYDLEVGAGEDWDSVVKRSVDAGATGIEGLSLIPGTTGATPVQNVGAYGQEIAQTLQTIEAYDNQTGSFVTLKNGDCDFGYRTSRFKTKDHGRFFITKLNLRLRIGNPQPPFYPALAQYLKQNGVKTATPQSVRDGVISLRQQKMPDPNQVANNGSFFANPIIPRSDFELLADQYPSVVHWKVGDHDVKISAAWLLEAAGFRNFHDPETGMATWPNQCLVLVNEHASSTSDLLKFRNKIIDQVEQMSGITLRQEPELLPR